MYIIHEMRNRDIRNNESVCVLHTVDIVLNSSGKEFTEF